MGSDTCFLRGFSSLTYDSNVLRVSSDLDPNVVLGKPYESDVIFGYGVGARLNLPVSRQLFRADASVTEYRYHRFDQLDFTGYALSGSWDWRAGDDWHGQLALGGQRQRQAYSSAVRIATPFLLDSYRGRADARYALTPRWELEAGMGYYSYRYPDSTLKVGDFLSWTPEIAANYTSPQGNSTGARLRYEAGQWPNRPPATALLFDSEYQQYTLSAVINWQLTGRSQLTGDVGYTSRTHPTASQRNFAGVSGQLNYDYLLSGKATLRASAFQTIGPIEDVVASYVRQRGLALTPMYQLTGKTTLQFNAGWRRDYYLGNSLNIGYSQRQDIVWSLGPAAISQLTRLFSVSTGLRYEQRQSNVPFGDYRDFTAYINGQVEF